MAVVRHRAVTQHLTWLDMGMSNVPGSLVTITDEALVLKGGTPFASRNKQSCPTFLPVKSVQVLISVRFTSVTAVAPVLALTVFCLIVATVASGDILYFP